MEEIHPAIETEEVLFQLHGLPAMGNTYLKGRTHFAKQSAEINAWKRQVWAAVQSQKPKTPLPRCDLYLTRFSANEPDYDGLVISFKPIVDGLVDAGVLADDRLSTTGEWHVRWQRASRGQGYILVRVVPRALVDTG